MKRVGPLQLYALSLLVCRLCALCAPSVQRCVAMFCAPAHTEAVLCMQCCLCLNVYESVLCMHHLRALYSGLLLTALCEPKVCNTVCAHCVRFLGALGLMAQGGAGCIAAALVWSVHTPVLPDLHRAGCVACTHIATVQTPASPPCIALSSRLPPGKPVRHRTV